MDKETIYNNDAALDAWNEWKLYCAVEKVSYAGKDGGPRGILRRLIFSAFKKKYEAICPLQADEIMRDGMPSAKAPDGACKKAAGRNARNNPAPQNNKDGHINYWTSEFDAGVALSNPPKDFMEKLEQQEGKDQEFVKCYKDFVWYLLKDKDARTEQKEILKTIQGKLIGRHSIINGIAERYLRENHYELWFNYNQNRSRGTNKTEADSPNADKEKTTQTIRPKKPMKMESFDHARVTPDNENSEGKRPEDTISDSSTVHYHEDKRDLVKEYREKLSDFTWEELAIILAKMVKMSASKETQDFVNWGDEKIASHWNNVLKKKCMDPRYSDLLNHNVNLTLFLIKERLKAEKGSEQFLTAYEEKLKNKLATKRMENK